MANRTELPIAFAEDGSVVINFGIVSGERPLKQSWIGWPMCSARLEQALT